MPSASRAVYAARLQGGAAAHARMHGLLLRHLDTPLAQQTDALAEIAGLDVDRFLGDLDTTAVQHAVKDDVRLARRLGVTSTPAMFLEGRRVPDLLIESEIFWRTVATSLRSDLPNVLDGAQARAMKDRP